MDGVEKKNDYEECVDKENEIYQLRSSTHNLRSTTGNV